MNPNIKIISRPDQIIINLVINYQALLLLEFSSVNIMPTEALEMFKKLIKTWDGEMRKCHKCSYNKNH